MSGNMDQCLAYFRSSARPSAIHRFTVAGLGPLDSQLARQLRPQLGLKDVARSLAVLIERRASLGGSEREPAPVALCSGHVGDQDVGVKGGIAGAAHAVAKCHRAEALPGLDLLAPGSALNKAGFLFEVGNAGGDGAVIAGDDLGACLLVAQRVDQRDRLGGRESHVIGKHRLLGSLAAGRVGEGADRRAVHQLLAGERVAAVEDRRVGTSVDLAFEPKLCRQLAQPLARCLAGLFVVVLAALGHGLDPVAGVGALDFGDSHHRPLCPRKRAAASPELPSS